MQEGGRTFEPHNFLLVDMIDRGLPGLVLLLVGLAVSLASALRLPAAMRAPPVAALLGMIASSFFLSNMKFKFFWIVLAYIAVSETVAAASRARQRSALPTVNRLVPTERRP
jgi:hypothetical protein